MVTRITKCVTAASPEFARAVVSFDSDTCQANTAVGFSNNDAAHGADSSARRLSRWPATSYSKKPKATAEPTWSGLIREHLHHR
jgi:hypothetical protein